LAVVATAVACAFFGVTVGKWKSVASCFTNHYTYCYY
jgi:hypothetical protein